MRPQLRAIPVFVFVLMLAAFRFSAAADVDSKLLDAAEKGDISTIRVPPGGRRRSQRRCAAELCRFERPLRSHRRAPGRWRQRQRDGREGIQPAAFCCIGGTWAGRRCSPRRWCRPQRGRRLLTEHPASLGGLRWDMCGPSRPCCALAPTPTRRTHPDVCRSNSPSHTNMRKPRVFF